MFVNGSDVCVVLDSEGLGMVWVCEGMGIVCGSMVVIFMVVLFGIKFMIMLEWVRVLFSGEIWI